MPQASKHSMQTVTHPGKDAAMRLSLRRACAFRLLWLRAQQPYALMPHAKPPFVYQLRVQLGRGHFCAWSFLAFECDLHAKRLQMRCACPAAGDLRGYCLPYSQHHWPAAAILRSLAATAAWHATQQPLPLPLRLLQMMPLSSKIVAVELLQCPPLPAQGLPLLAQ